MCGCEWYHPTTRVWTPVSCENLRDGKEALRWDQPGDSPHKDTSTFG